MRHPVASIAHQGAPFKGAYYLSGLGASEGWPKGRSYWSVANFRAPYDDGYFQDNDLMGIKEDVSVVARQVPTWAYIAGGLVFSAIAYKAYKGKRK